MLRKLLKDAYYKAHGIEIILSDDSSSLIDLQRQVEFFEAWDKISNYYNDNTKSLTFLEVGAWKGIWGMAFAEFCNYKGIKGSYTTITMIDDHPGNNYLYNTMKYMNKIGVETNLVNMDTMDSRSVHEVTSVCREFNIVFIDANHKYDWVINDINKFSKLSTDILMFHDIRPILPSSSCSVYKALIDSGIKLDDEISVDSNEMGIGIKYIKY